MSRNLGSDDTPSALISNGTSIPMSCPSQFDMRLNTEYQETSTCLTNVATQNRNISPQATMSESFHDSRISQSLKPMQTLSKYTSIQSDEAFRPDICFPKSENDEPLPSYSCSVCKMGYVNIKQDMKEATAKPPFLQFTLQNAKAEPALDYLKRPSVIRLKIYYGPQFLMRTNNPYEMAAWLEHLRAAINISLDLDQRPMPKFRTLPLRQRRVVIPLYQQILQELQEGVPMEVTFRPDLDYAMAVAFSPVDDDQDGDAATI
ncbi:hypothetical protein NQZ79_g8344 [Umbelopsis isabellina]|nr:hypothetical protein NQZ79_g8344 [Umbelopsis isabellina]